MKILLETNGSDSVIIGTNTDLEKIIKSLKLVSYIYAPSIYSMKNLNNFNGENDESSGLLWDGKPGNFCFSPEKGFLVYSSVMVSYGGRNRTVELSSLWKKENGQWVFLSSTELLRNIDHEKDSLEKEACVFARNCVKQIAIRAKDSDEAASMIDEFSRKRAKYRK